MSTGSGGPLLSGPVLTRAAGFGAPLALAMLGHGLFNLVDMIIVARLGPGAIASVTIGGIILPVAMVLFDGLNGATATLVAHAMGAKNVGRAREVAGESLVVATIAGIGVSVLFFAASPALIAFFDLGNATIVADAVAYLEVMAAGTLGMFLILQTTSILRGLGDALRPMVILVLANVLNVVLDIGLIYGRFGLPALGVVGAAWATVIAQGLGAAAGVVLVFRGSHGVGLRGYRFHLGFRHLRKLFFVGLPTSLQLVVRVLSIFFLLRIARSALGADAVAFVDGVGLCVRLEMTVVFLGLGWAAAATPFVGQNLGAGRADRARAGAWVLVLCATASMAILGSLLWVYRVPILRFVSPESTPEAFGHAVDYLALTVPIYGALGVALVLSRALNGAGSTKTPLLLDLGLYLAVLLPLATLWSSGSPADGGSGDAAGAWKAIVLVHLLAAAAYVGVFLTGRWIRKSRRLFEAEAAD